MAKLATLTDDFDDNIIDPSLWTADPGITETIGRLIITPSTATPALRSISFYDATESGIVFHIPTVTPPGSSGTLSCGVALRPDANNAVAFTKTPTDLICQKQVGGIYTTVATFTYDSPTMQYWRMRETTGIFYWETSIDGIGWTPRFNTFVSPSLFPITSVKVLAYASFTGSEFFPGNLQINSINLGLRITASGSSTSDGSARILTTHTLTGSTSSTSFGSAAITIHSATVFAMTGVGASTSSGTAMMFVHAPGQLTAFGQSYSSGSAAFRVQLYITAIAQSYATGTATISIIPAIPDSTITQYFYFEPPVVYDRPTTIHPPRPKYINAYARWQGGQARGRSVLRYGNQCQVIDTPTVDQTNTADAYYAGGHVYIIDNLEADKLSACGLIVTPIPLRFTLFPDEDVFPQTDTFPGFQDFVLP